MSLEPGEQLLAEGRAAAVPVGISRFCAARGAASELDYKRLSVADGRVMFHAHVGLNTWPATAAALQEITAELAERGHVLDRYGLALDRGMGLPPERRALVAKETGPRLDDEDWAALATVADTQPHLGDFMIGTEASVENTQHALRNGITTVGNLGQFLAFGTPGADDLAVVRATVRALGVMAAARGSGALVHSYLDDGLAMQLGSYGDYLAWAALEIHVVESMAGARLTHCYGGLVPQPAARALIGLTLRRLHGTGGAGSMVYGNTVDYSRDLAHNGEVLSEYLLTDIATQLHAPTGHAVNPVPLTENLRIPSAADILEVQLLAREIEADARRSADLFDWADLDRQADAAAEYALATSRRMLALLEEDGVPVDDVAGLLAVLRRTDVVALERRLGTVAPEGIARWQPWKASTMRRMADDLAAAAHDLHGVRVVLACLDVHDLARDVIRSSLVRLGAEVVQLPTDSLPEAVARAAVAEDADAVIASTYNGSALTVGSRLHASLAALDYDGVVVMGGVLNEDRGGDLPVDVRADLEALGIRCPETLADVPAMVAGR
ncbi:MAG TPA: hypothetical protein VFL59_16775 [Candidatus Nanopelagicales bacterium]|nr:hypothetical protein [Candidatus Nanopelagicales bacterium]